ncbi:hypothetical protein [Niallia nealsonii]|uniref:Uncharacterized protein n=1 Tax=Niallia nealsonii TaxID=115979 RepID=A0A2N0YZH2_9BACI|nr:hypothetical protein [Niallia nealsonii]PKG22649.1 hypothetical protein CWS01_16090 [Niallia nealsonii]
MNDFKDYHQFVKSQKVKGFKIGFSFHDFQKEEKVGVFYSDAPTKTPVFIEGAIIEIKRTLNAQGKDTIRYIVVDLGHVHRQINGNLQIYSKG